MSASILVLLVVVAGLGIGWLPGIGALAAALWILANGLGLQLSTVQFFLVGAVLLMVPAAAWLAGALLDHFAWRRVHGGVFAALALGFACAAATRSGLLYGYIEAAFAAVQPGVRPLLLFGAVINATLLVAAVTALAIMAVQLVIELPFQWLCGAARLPVMLPFAALRPLVICLALSLMLQGITGLFAAELQPGKVAAAVGTESGSR